MRIMTAAIIQESNTFSPKTSTMADFTSHRFLTGDDILRDRTENELYGFHDAARLAGVDVVPTVAMNAISSGVLRADAWDELQALMQSVLRQADDCDGIYLVLHGAMVAEGCDDVEGALLELVREAVGPGKPLVVSLDLHANVTRRMVRLTDGIVGFRTYPHVDFAETGRRAAELLLGIVREGQRPHTALRKLPMIVPAENSQSSHGPFAELWREAEAGECRGASLCTSLFPVQPWLDIAEMGFAVTVVGMDRESAEHEADRLAEEVWARRHRFDIRLYSVDEVMRLMDQAHPDGRPYVVSDSADSPGAGSTGDSNAVLKALLQHRAEEKWSCLLTLVDAPAVSAAIAAGVGSEVTLPLGYTLNPNRSHGWPIVVTGRVRRIGDGTFMLKGGYAKNTKSHMGRCVVLDIGRISVLVTEKPTFSGDPSMYRSMGLEPAEADLVLVKSANQFRADYEQLTDRIYILDTPGSSSANLRGLPFRRLERPCFPLDDITDWRQYTP